MGYVKSRGVYGVYTQKIGLTSPTLGDTGANQRGPKIIPWTKIHKLIVGGITPQARIGPANRRVSNAQFHESLIFPLARLARAQSSVTRSTASATRQCVTRAYIRKRANCKSNVAGY